VIVDCQDAANNLAITPPAENAAMYSSSPSGPSRPAQGSARPGSPCYIPRASAQRHPHSTRSEQSRQTTPSPTSPTDPIPRRPSDSPNSWCVPTLRYTERSSVCFWKRTINSTILINGGDFCRSYWQCFWRAREDDDIDTVLNWTWRRCLTQLGTPIAPSPSLPPGYDLTCPPPPAPPHTFPGCWRADHSAP